MHCIAHADTTTTGSAALRRSPGYLAFRSDVRIGLIGDAYVANLAVDLIFSRDSSSLHDLHHAFIVIINNFYRDSNAKGRDLNEISFGEAFLASFGISLIAIKRRVAEVVDAENLVSCCECLFPFGSCRMWD